MKMSRLRAVLFLIFLNAFALTEGSAQTAWVNQSPSAVTEHLWSAVYGAGKFVVVGVGGVILTSQDGSVWTRRNSNVTDWLVAVCYGNGVFVAVGDNGRILLSTDAISWSLALPVTTSRLNGVIHANGVYVAVGENGVIVSSTNGVQWTQRDSRGITTWLHGITHANGAFLATGEKGHFIRSNDGVTWTAFDVPNLTLDCENLVAGQGLIVVVTSGSAGEIWTAPVFSGPWIRRAVNSAGYLEGVAYGPKGFVATGAAGSILSSTDGITWSTRASGTTRGFYGAAFAFNRYLAFGEFGSVLSSTVPFGSVPAIVVPQLLPAGATQVESRALAEQSRGSVIVAVSGQYPAGRLPANAGEPPTARFTNPQPYNLSYVARLLSTGQPDPEFTSAPGGDGTVNALVVQPDGKILVGGTFSTFIGVAFRNLARLLSDGKADATFNIGSGPASPAAASAQVNALAIQSDGSILVGGTFQTFQGLARPYLVRLSPSGALDGSFTPAFNGSVNTVVVQPDGRILVGGNFTSVRGVARNRIVRLLTDGAIDPAFDAGTGANNEVVSIRLQSSGAILAGGDFTTFAGQTRGRLVRMLSSGAIDPAFLSTATVNDTVISIAVDADGNILLGGAFTQVNGAVRNRLARLLPNGALDTGFDPGDGANRDVRAVLPRSDGTVFLGGLFDQYQGTGSSGVVGVLGMPVAVAFTQAPRSLTVNAGGTARFEAEATGSGALTYQWYKDGIGIAGATDRTLTVTNATSATEGRYSLQASSPTGSAMSDNATLTVSRGEESRIVNLSVLTSLDAQDPLFSLGFVVGGNGTSGTKPLLVRVVGPSLVAFAFSDALADPKLRFFTGTTLRGENDNWAGSAALTALMVQVGAFPLAAPSSRDAAFSPANLTPGANSVEVSGVAGATGAVLAEIYDATPAAAFLATTPRLVNVSVLKRVPAGTKLTAGFVISGASAKTVLIRAIGPTLALAPFGVIGALGDPQLTLFQDIRPIATNDNWGGSAELRAVFLAVGAFALDDASRDAALLVSLLPGSYSAAVSATGATAGTALVEVYEVP